MNIPTHIAAGALVSAIGITWRNRHLSATGLNRRPIVTGLLCVGCSLGLHLLIDAVPHYNVVYKIFAFPALPAIPRLTIVALKVALLSLPVLFLVRPFLKTDPVLVVTTLFASIYPDLEKGFYLNLPFPRWLVLFWQHSGSYSADGGDEQKVAALSIEGTFLIVSMLLVFWLASRHQHSFPAANRRRHKGKS